MNRNPATVRLVLSLYAQRVNFLEGLESPIWTPGRLRIQPPGFSLARRNRPTATRASRAGKPTGSTGQSVAGSVERLESKPAQMARNASSCEYQPETNRVSVGTAERGLIKRGNASSQSDWQCSRLTYPRVGVSCGRSETRTAQQGSLASRCSA